MFYVGIALANIVSIINPHLILLSGAIFTNLHNAEVVQDSLMKHAFLADYESLRVVPLDMGNMPGLSERLPAALKSILSTDKG